MACLWKLSFPFVSISIDYTYDPNIMYKIHTLIYVLRPKIDYQHNFSTANQSQNNQNLV